MIASHRQRHRRTWLVLAVLIPAIFALAWLARRPSEDMDRLPPELREGSTR